MGIQWAIYLIWSSWLADAAALQFISASKRTGWVVSVDCTRIDIARKPFTTHYEEVSFVMPTL